MLWRFWYCNNGQKSLRFSSGQRPFSIVLQKIVKHVFTTDVNQENCVLTKHFMGVTFAIMHPTNETKCNYHFSFDIFQRVILKGYNPKENCKMFLSEV